jgi:hypothetical protein
MVLIWVSVIVNFVICMHICSGKIKRLHIYVVNNNVIYFASIQISSPIMTVNLLYTVNF